MQGVPAIYTRESRPSLILEGLICMWHCMCACCHYYSCPHKFSLTASFICPSTVNAIGPAPLGGGLLSIHCDSQLHVIELPNWQVMK